MVQKIKRALNNERGDFLEALFITPIMFLIIAFIFEIGSIMYDYGTVYYASYTAAIQSARVGAFNNTIRADTGTFLNNWTTRGKELGIVQSIAKAEDSENIVIWGTNPVTNVQRGQSVQVGIIYPIKFRIFFFEDIRKWTVKEETLTLKSSAVASSEQYFEP